MAASSPISAIASPTSRPLTTVSGPGANAPSVMLPLRFVLTGLMALCAGVVWLMVQPMVLTTYHYNQHTVAVTHLFVLGWICSVVMGAMYQLVPVALETKLYSERLARWHFILHVVGFAGMVWMFRAWNFKNVGHFGSVLAAGVALFVYNLFRTLRRVPKWNVTASAVSAALVWISLTVTAGLLVAAGKSSYEIEDAAAGSTAAIVHALRWIAGLLAHFNVLSTMHAHAHLGGVGVFIMLIVGVSYKLVPMFTLSEVQSRRRAAFSVILLNLGLAGSFVTILKQSPWKLAFALTVVAALAVYGRELVAIVRARRRRAVDWGIRYFLTAVALLCPLSLLAVVLSWPGLPMTPLTGQLENVYGFLGLIGVITFAIIGMLYKIIPFLVWFRSYSRQIGRARVPALADLYSARLQAVGYWSYLAGLAIACGGIVFMSQMIVRAGCGLLAGSLVVLLLNVGMMLLHFVKPRLEPLAFATTAVPKPA